MKDRLRLRTLVIDDDESVCRKVRAWLEAAAYDVVTFTNPAEGLQHAARVPCELALVDLRLPGANGADVIASLRSASPQTRVVAMTAFPDAQQVIAALRAGARDLLEKPVQAPSLLAALERQLAELGVTARSEREYNARLGARLRALRNEGGRTLADVAVVADITAAQLSQIELGKTATSTWTLARICSALKVPLVRLFESL